MNNFYKITKYDGIYSDGTKATQQEKYYNCSRDELEKIVADIKNTLIEEQGIVIDEIDVTYINTK